MGLFKKKQLSPEQQEMIAVKDFFDMVLPGTLRFFPDRYICGNYHKCVWAVTEYPPNTALTGAELRSTSTTGLSSLWSNAG